MLEPRIKATAESIVVRYPRVLRVILWVTACVGLLLVLTGLTIGTAGIGFAVVGAADTALCMWVATASIRIDLRGVRIRLFRAQFVGAKEIASLRVTSVARNGLSRDYIVVVRRDGSQLRLDQATMGFPAPASDVVRSRLRDMNRRLQRPDTT